MLLLLKVALRPSGHRIKELPYAASKNLPLQSQTRKCHSLEPKKRKSLIDDIIVVFLF